MYICEDIDACDEVCTHCEDMYRKVIVLEQLTLI